MPTVSESASSKTWVSPRRMRCISWSTGAVERVTYTAPPHQFVNADGLGQEQNNRGRPPRDARGRAAFALECADQFGAILQRFFGLCAWAAVARLATDCSNSSARSRVKSGARGSLPSGGPLRCESTSSPRSASTRRMRVLVCNAARVNSASCSGVPNASPRASLASSDAFNEHGLVLHVALQRVQQLSLVQACKFQPGDGARAPPLG